MFCLRQNIRQFSWKTVRLLPLYEELSNKIFGSFFRVHNELGAGLFESCYHNALYFELRSLGMNVAYNAAFSVKYKSEVVGEFFADLSVENKVIIEIKSVNALVPAHEAQLLNYLKISKVRVGYLANFHGSRVVFKRYVV